MVVEVVVFDVDSALMLMIESLTKVSEVGSLYLSPLPTSLKSPSKTMDSGHCSPVFDDQKWLTPRCNNGYGNDGGVPRWEVDAILNTQILGLVPLY